MFIIGVVPLKRIPRGIPQSLTYFSSKQLETGILVMVKIRSKDTLAIVISCEDARNKKIEIKKSGFELKPIDKIILLEPILTVMQIETAFWISNYFIEPLSLVFKSLTPQLPAKIANNPSASDRLKIEPLIKNIGSMRTDQLKPLLIKSSNTIESLIFLRDKIEKNLDESRQILVLVPENSSVQPISELLKNNHPGTEILTIAKRSAKNKFWDEYGLIKSGKAKIIIGTRSASLLPFLNLGMIMVLGEHSDSHKQWEGHPLYDSRDVAAKVAEIFKADLVFESYSPTVVSYWKAMHGIYDLADLKSEKEKSLIEVVNMRDEQKKDNYSIFSEYFIEKLENTIRNNGRAVLFLNRKGSANFVICKSCGNIAKCPTCQIPLVFYADNEYIDPDKKNKLLCNHCGFITDLPRQCSKCKGAAIKYLGLGTQKAETQLKKIFPRANIIRLDSDSAKNPKNAKGLLGVFRSTAPCILIGTQLLLSVADLPEISFIGVISLDAMLAVPSFKTDEKVFDAVWQLTNLSKNIAIQTYSFEHPLLRSFTALDYEAFAAKELNDRKILFYPPFSKIIKLKLKSQDRERGKNEVAIVSSQIRERLKEHIAQGNVKISKPVPAFIFQEKGFYNWHIIIKIKNEEIQGFLHDDKLMLGVAGFLARIVPSNWDIDVNPESLI